MTTKKRPSLKKRRQEQAYGSPEELFDKLPGRSESHGFLRVAQADALREYIDRQNDTDIAFELPAGTGKTAVGLLIAEWSRRKHKKPVAFLCLNNQLAGQVLAEGERLGISCADLRGNRARRQASEEGRFRDAKAVGVSTFANLFNVNPVIHDTDVLVLDDAHGGEQQVNAMWTVRINQREQAELYSNLIQDIAESLELLDLDEYGESSGIDKVELIEIAGHELIQNLLRRHLDFVGTDEAPSVRYPWDGIRRHLDACALLISAGDIVIRPWIPPTHTHAPFIEPRQRIYLSATLGGEGDLMRGYGIQSVTRILAPMPQWATRYIFIPDLVLEPDESIKFCADIWNRLKSRRALLLAPSFVIADRVFSKIYSESETEITRFEARDIEESIDQFSQSDDAMLTVAGRYDGIDLPGDDCRLQIMAESPIAVGPLETYLRNYWRLGPIMRRRERTRLIQGMGRCTRHSTDYAVIILLGESLMSCMTTPALVNGFPGEIKKEIEWGKNIVDQYRDEPEQIVEVVLGLLEDATYRKEANEDIESIEEPVTESDPELYDRLGRTEVQFGQALWDKDFTGAYKYSHEIADTANSSELIGYRGLWWYLAATAARLKKDNAAFRDCLDIARRCRTNTGFLDRILRSLPEAEIGAPNLSEERGQAYKITRLLEKFGNKGSSFNKWCDNAEKLLGATDHHPHYHEGLDYLGQMLGADVIRSTEQGAPDVVWLFPQTAITIEAKTERDDPSKATLSKKDVQEANGHIDWLRNQRPEYSEEIIVPIVVSPSLALHHLALPHIKGLKGMETSRIIAMYKEQKKLLDGFRVERRGKSETELLQHVMKTLEQRKLTAPNIVQRFVDLKQRKKIT